MKQSLRKVLISGGRGLIGMRLSEMLIDAGYEVAHLSRQTSHGHYCSFRWDPATGQIDEGALRYADYVVNLAGASVSDEKWSEERKREILDSRVGGTNLLARELRERDHHVKAFISASAIGIYGDANGRLLDETTPPAPSDDFLATVATQWEQAAHHVQELGIRTVVTRIGIVLSDAGGALPQIARPVKLMAGAALGSGKQYMSWIHIDDLCRLLIQMMEDTDWQGTYNAVTPNPVTNKEFTTTLAEVLHRPLVLPKVPEFGLKLVMGEMSEIVLASQRVSAQKVLQQGFQFEYPELKQALEALYGEE
ncbi:TIGR01777 family protein [Hymenobacter busanensis]|uniref:TIGR01777 family protein n=1 Tax=Hymenobacter busanensis TaxID=2607656 RepID=A0A7L5A0Y0_9BACT|nr:TIGR01777 family oxidoreductase [Hymenobacter busanensis]KAA9338373.1 TIGR01777 family protein [Hymenobacter busanensis]QHJ09201.1 TIGR01777 family protein [Hymenobacter busanensis]